jgi:hypothetical protein
MMAGMYGMGYTPLRPAGVFAQEVTVSPDKALGKHLCKISDSTILGANLHVF